MFLESGVQRSFALTNAHVGDVNVTRDVVYTSTLSIFGFCVDILDEGGTKITIYGKPTHTYQYLNYRSHHPLEHERSVVRILTSRAKQYVTTTADHLADRHHMEDALKANNYDNWALHLPSKSRAKPTSTTQGHPQPTKMKPMLGLPFIKGVSETPQRNFVTQRVHLYHKPANTTGSPRGQNP